jgi:hypothetical protein
VDLTYLHISFRSRLAQAMQQIAISVWSAINALLFAKLSKFLANFLNKSSEESTETHAGKLGVQNAPGTLDKSTSSAATFSMATVGSTQAPSASSTNDAETKQDSAHMIAKYRTDWDDNAVVLAKLAGDAASVRVCSFLVCACVCL